jgi:hypothetical protein
VSAAPNGLHLPLRALTADVAAAVAAVPAMATLSRVDPGFALLEAHKAARARLSH